ncbi:MAG: sel1 repeat family protein [Clostridia bacterium]|nr:sel1 repeat family protein [Clostridia bacterium]
MNENKTKIEIEAILIQLSIYYMICTRGIDEKYTIKDCSNVLKEEIKNKNTTLFHVKKEDHIINKLYEKMKKIEKMEYENYKEILEDTILKMRYFYNFSKDNSLMSTALEKDVEELAYNILYFNMGTDQLKKLTDVHAEYELGERYLDAEMDKLAFECYSKAAEKGHKLAAYRRIICIYKGYGTEKNEELAFEEIRKFIKEFVFSKAELLLGEMYFEKEIYEEAFKQFKKMEKWETRAKFYLALMYMGGLGVDKDEDEAKNLLIEAVNARNKEAIDYVLENGLVLIDD